MVTYEMKLPIEVQITRPDAKYYILLDRQLEGCKEGLQQATVYIRQSFMIHDEAHREVFMKLGTRKITDMEVLAKLIHQMHGVDDRYYDESNDDSPAFALITPLHDQKKDIHKKTEEEKHHVNNDVCAAIMRDIQFEEDEVKKYDTLIAYIKDDGANIALEYLKKSTQKTMNELRNLLHDLTIHGEVKDFGEGNTHNAWDLDTSNAFDKPNPIFINPSELEDLPFK